MKQYFKNKDGEVRAFEVENGKVLTTIELNSRTIVNPTIEQFEASGWTPCEPPEPVLPTIEELVEGKLRERYSINKEFEVQRKRDNEPEAFAAYYAYVEECIELANEQPHRDEHPAPDQPENG